MGLGEALAIVGILISIIGIIITIYCWKHTWKKVHALHIMKSIDFTEEGDFQKFGDYAKQHVEEKDKNEEAPFVFNGDLKNDTKAALYNMQNYLHKTDRT